MLCYSVLRVSGKSEAFTLSILKRQAATLMLKTLIIVLMVAVVISLFSGLFFLIKDGGKTNRVVNSLAVRVTLSILLLVIIAIALWQGSLTLNPTP
jgi:protein-S-isoprenylcysteine O-methyltransferase Ste14